MAVEKVGICKVDKYLMNINYTKLINLDPSSRKMKV